MVQTIVFECPIRNPYGQKNVMLYVTPLTYPYGPQESGVEHLKHQWLMSSALTKKQASFRLIPHFVKLHPQLLGETQVALDTGYVFSVQS